MCLIVMIVHSYVNLAETEPTCQFKQRDVVTFDEISLRCDLTTEENIVRYDMIYRNKI